MMRGWQVAMRVHLKGIHSVRSKGCVYHYAWRGGPRIKAEPGSPAFMREYQEAHAARQRPPENCLFTLIVEFKQSAEFGGLSARTKSDYLDVPSGDRDPLRDDAASSGRGSEGARRVQVVAGWIFRPPPQG